MTAIVDLSNMPVVDAHCHSYLETSKVLNGEDLAKHASLAAQPSFLDASSPQSDPRVAIGRQRLSAMYRTQPFMLCLVRLLSQFLGCEVDLDTVAKKRSERAESFDAYVRELFEDARIRGLVMDGAYPPITREDLKRFPATVVRIFRIEPLIKDLVARLNSFDEMCSAYESAIRDAIIREGYTGLKSIIAYRTGLKIQHMGPVGAARDFYDAKRGRAEVAWFGPKVKRLRDFLFIKALELSIELNVPMQVHTGVGDYDIVLDQSDPTLIYELLKDEKLRHATVVLVHSGFPNNQNAAFIASVLPNVFLDFSLTIPFLNPIGHDRLMEILQVAPSSKIMYGSDAFNLPETIWLGAKVAKVTLGKCLRRFVEGELFDESEATNMGKRILFENANELYRLGLT